MLSIMKMQQQNLLILLNPNVITTLTNYSTTNLQKFEGLFRYSQLMQDIDDTDTSILSNITTVKIRKDFTPTTGSAVTYNVYFRNALYNPHSDMTLLVVF